MRALLPLSAFLVLVAGCEGEPVDSGAPLLLGPILTHDAPEGPVDEGADVLLEVGAEDEDGVDSVILYYRSGGSTYWDSAPMALGDLWATDLSGEDVEAPTLEYYFKATDGRGLVSYLPEASSAEPFTLEVTEGGIPLPFLETFDVDADGQAVDPSAGDDLYGLDWAVRVDGFAGYPWQLTSGKSWSGDNAAYHPRGYDGVETLEDWLISPPLDLSGNERIQVSWYEYGAAPDAADHTLWISTSERDPGAGTYEQVLSLAAPVEGEWTRSEIIDLGEWAGAELAYLAWRYTGSYADDWYMDDISVRSFTADLSAEIAWDPDPVWPGETTALTVTVTNHVDQGADDLTLSLSLPDGGGSLSAESVSLGSIAAAGTAEATVDLTIDETWPENSYLPLELSISDGLDTWSSSHDVVVGLVSTGGLTVEMDAEGYVDVYLGVGDPEAPLFETRVFNGTLAAGENLLEADLTDEYDLLPPAAGELRWYAQIASDADAALTRFEITYGGEILSSTDLPEIESGVEAIAYLPEPPDPTLDAATTDPETLEPGAVVVASFSLDNVGAATQGAVTVTLQSEDADVSLLDPGPYVLSDGAWERDEALETPDFLFGIADTAVDSKPVQLSLLVEDEVESWSLPVELEVPWVVLRVVEATIDDDDGGDGDGILEPGESATLELEIANTGELDTDGLAELAVTLADGSQVTAALPTETESIGSLDPGDTEGVDLELEIDASAVSGDVLSLELSLTDSRATYTTTLDITLGEAIWQYLSVTDDPIGDHNDYEFDLLNGQYRCDGQTLEFIFESATPYDPVTSFVEMFALNGGGGDYSFFRLVIQSGVAKLQGYDSGFDTIDTPTFEALDDYRMKVSMDVSTMDMSTGYLTAGFGSGWCTAETGAYCDHFPDDWGYYYTGYSSGDFFTILWD